MSTQSAREVRAAAVCGLLLAALALMLLPGCLRGPVSASTPGGSIGAEEASASVEPTLAGKVEPPASGAYIGVYRPPAPFDMTAFDSYEETISGKAPAILEWYQQWGDSGPHEFDQAWAVSAYERGAVPLISWEPWNPGVDSNFVKDPGTDPDWQLRDILDGTYDGYIRRWANSAKSLRGPVMIRPFHEMNGNWYPWGGTVNGNKPTEFKAAWRHVYDIFRQVGATNVTWVWSFNFESVPNVPENRISAYYPGDAYVDWVGLSGFNWGTSSPPDSRWKTFDQIYDKPLAYAESLGKPIVIAEFGSVEGGGDKAAWIGDAYARIRTRHPEVKAIVYFDSLEVGPENTQDWRIGSSMRSVEAYGTSVADPHFRQAPVLTLAEWTDTLSVPNWMHLRSLPAIY